MDPIGVCQLFFEDTTQTIETGTVVFLVPLQVSFLLTPLVHIKLSTNGWQDTTETM